MTGLYFSIYVIGCIISYARCLDSDYQWYEKSGYLPMKHFYEKEPVFASVIVFSSWIGVIIMIWAGLRVNEKIGFRFTYDD